MSSTLRILTNCSCSDVHLSLHSITFKCLDKGNARFCIPLLRHQRLIQHTVLTLIGAQEGWLSGVSIALLSVCYGLQLQLEKTGLEIHLWFPENMREEAFFKIKGCMPCIIHTIVAKIPFLVLPQITATSDWLGRNSENFLIISWKNINFCSSVYFGHFNVDCH